MQIINNYLSDSNKIYATSEKPVHSN